MVFKKILFSNQLDSDTLRNLGNQGFQSRTWKSMVSKRIFFLKWLDSGTLRNLGNQGFHSRTWKSMVFKRIFFLKWLDSGTLRNLGYQGSRSCDLKTMKCPTKPMKFKVLGPQQHRKGLIPKRRGSRQCQHLDSIEKV